MQKKLTTVSCFSLFSSQAAFLGLVIFDTNRHCEHFWNWLYTRREKKNTRAMWARRAERNWIKITQKSPLGKFTQCAKPPWGIISFPAEIIHVRLCIIVFVYDARCKILSLCLLTTRCTKNVLARLLFNSYCILFCCCFIKCCCCCCFGGCL